MYNAVGIDVSKVKSILTVLQPDSTKIVMECDNHPVDFAQYFVIKTFLNAISSDGTYRGTLQNPRRPTKN